MEQAKCRSCRAAILWLPSAATGALMPLDAEPFEGGNIAIVDGKAVVFHGDLFWSMVDDGHRYRSHFVSCPNAAKHRKAPEKKAKP